MEGQNGKAVPIHTGPLSEHLCCMLGRSFCTHLSKTLLAVSVDTWLTHCFDFTGKARVCACCSTYFCRKDCSCRVSLQLLTSQGYIQSMAGVTMQNQQGVYNDRHALLQIRHCNGFQRQPESHLHIPFKGNAHKMPCEPALRTRHAFGLQLANKR